MKPDATIDDPPSPGMREEPAFYDSLDQTLTEAWRLLVRGAADRRSPFHTPTVATLGLDGRPRARVVVLRAADPRARTLRFHTDRRTRKVEELAREPRLSLIGYDVGCKVQLRLEARASVHTDDAVADEAWAGSRSFSRVGYGTAPAPGTPIATGNAYALPPPDAAPDPGREHFGVVVLAVERLEWLYLAHRGHRRALFRFEDDGVHATWLAP